MDIIVILVFWCGLCGGLAYAVTPVSNKKPLGAILGAVFGPLGVLIAVFLKPDGEEERAGTANAIDTTGFDSLSQDDQYEKVSLALRPQETTKTIERLKAELAKMKSD